MRELISILYTTISIYSVMLLVRVLLTWFPNVDWSNPLFSTLRQLTDPYLNLFRSIVPTFGAWIFPPSWHCLPFSFSPAGFDVRSLLWWIWLLGPTPSCHSRGLEVSALLPQTAR